MNLFYKRPLLLALSLFLITSILSAVATPAFRLIGLWASLAASASLFLIVILMFFTHKAWTRHACNLLLCSVLCFSAFTSNYSFFDRTLSELEEQTEPVTIIAEIKECTFLSDYSTIFTAKVERINDSAADFSIELSYPGNCALKIGNRIEAAVRLTPFSENVYGYNERNSNIAKGVLISGEFSSYTELDDAAPSLDSAFRDLRTRITMRLESANMQNADALAKALLIGDSNSIGSTVKQDFRRLGISHILAISGTHFTTLLGMFALLLFACGIHKRAVYILLIPLAFLYMGFTGFSVTVCRAGIMCILSYWGFLCGRMRDSYTALFLSVVAILFISPYAVYSVGLWLSFSATFIILILMELFATAEIFKKRTSLGAKIVFFFLTRTAIAIAVTIFTLPITAAFFGEISIVSTLSNLFIVPLFEFFLYLIPFTAAFPGFLPLTKLTDLLGSVILSLTERFAEKDALLICVKQPFVIAIAITGVAITLLLVALPLKKRGLVLLPSAVSVLSIAVGLALFFHAHDKVTEITCYTEGENDGIVLIDRNAALCIDISNGGGEAAYKSEYIAAEGFCPEISGYMFTHYHVRHVNQFLKLTNRTNVHTVYLPLSDLEEDTGIIASLCDIAEERNINIVRFSYGEPVPFAESTVTLYPPQHLSRSTHEVVSLKIEGNEQEFIYIGSSHFETDLSLDDEISNAEYLFFGQHSPVVKKSFSAITEAFCIYGSGRLFSLSELQNPCTLMEADDQYKILLK